MLAGEPPVTGPTAQAMIAKLMTERPVHLRVVRTSVPEAVDAAVAKALDKTPADRFASAGDFARALEVRTVTGAGTEPTVVLPAPRPRRRLGVILAVVLLASSWRPAPTWRPAGGRRRPRRPNRSPSATAPSSPSAARCSSPR